MPELNNSQIFTMQFGTNAQVLSSIRHAPNINATDSNRMTMLMYLSRRGFDNAVDELVKSGANVNAIDKNGNSALMIAVRTGHSNVVNVLAKHGVDVNAVDERGNIPLIVAIKAKHGNVVNALIEHGGDVTSSRGPIGDTPLMVAVEMGHQEIICDLLRNGADVNATNRFGNSALIIASQKGQKEIIHILVKHGANVNHIDQNGYTALTWLLDMSDENPKDIVEFFIDNGADVNAKGKNGQGPLMAASKKHYKDSIHILVEHGADINISYYSTSPLIEAIKNKDDDLIDLFLNNGVNVININGWKKTPLMIAEHEEYDYAIELLSKREQEQLTIFNNIKKSVVNQDINSLKKQFNELNATNNLEIVMSIKAILSNMDETGEPIFHTAVNTKNGEIIKFLAKNDADVDIYNIEGLTPLISAILKEDDEVVRVLLQVGVNANQCTYKLNDNKTPLIIASDNNYKNISKLLVEHGANTDGIDLSLIDFDGDSLEKFQSIKESIANQNIHSLEKQFNELNDISNAKAIMSHKDEMGDTILHMMIKSKNIDILKASNAYDLSLAPYRNIKNNNNLTSLDILEKLENSQDYTMFCDFINNNLFLNINQDYLLGKMITYLKKELKENPGQYQESDIKLMTNKLQSGHCYGLSTLWGESMMRESENNFFELLHPIAVWDEQIITPEVRKSFEKAISIIRFSHGDDLNEQDLKWLKSMPIKHALAQKPNFESRKQNELEYIIDSKSFKLNQKPKKFELSREATAFYLETLHNHDNLNFLSLSANRHNIGLYFKDNEISIYDSNYQFIFRNNFNFVTSNKFTIKEGNFNYTQISKEIFKRFDSNYDNPKSLSFETALISLNNVSHSLENFAAPNKLTSQENNSHYKKIPEFVASVLFLLICYETLKSLISCCYGEKENIANEKKLTRESCNDNAGEEIESYKFRNMLNHKTNDITEQHINM